MEIDSETELLSDSDSFDINSSGEDSDDSSSYESDYNAQNDSENDTAVSMYREWNETQAGESAPPLLPRFPFTEINSGTTSISDTAEKTPLDFMNMFFTDQLVRRRRRRRRRLKGIHSRSDTNRTGAEGLSFYYPRLLHCLNQMLAVRLLS